MRQLLKLDQQLASKPGVRMDGDSVFISNGVFQFDIPGAPRKNLRIHIDRSRAAGKRIEISGWAFGRETEHPVKRIYLSVDNRIIAVGMPELRTDVRRVFHLDYDHYGFKIGGESTFQMFDGDAVDLLVFDGVGLIHVPTTIKDSASSADVGRRVFVSETSVSFYDEEGTKKRELAITEDIRLHVDKAEVTPNEVKVRGWCFDRALQDERLAICVLRGSNIVSRITPCRLKREDVAEALGVVSENPFQGYEVKFDRSNLKEGEPLKILSIVDSNGGRRASVTDFPYKKVIYRD